MSLKAHGIANLGRDAELRYTPSGQAVANLALAFSHKGKEGEITQWVDGILWGKQAESLSQYLTKGKKVSVDLRNMRVETFEGKNGTGTKLIGDIVDLEFASSKKDDGQPTQQAAPRQAPPPRPAPAPIPQRPAAPPPSSGFDDMDGDIPFVSCDWALEVDTSKAKRMRRYDF